MYGSKEDMVPRVYERLIDRSPLAGDNEEEVLGPKLVPISPIMRHAMQEVVREYHADDDGTKERVLRVALGCSCAGVLSLPHST